MRDNIKAMMDREVAQRRSAQARLADALESSQEGVVVVDADDCIALANAQAADFLGVAARAAEAGHAARRSRSRRCADPVEAPAHPARHDGELPATGEAQLADGRWLRISHSATRDGGFIVVCSDISQSKQQEASAAADQPAARRRARQHVAGPLPVTTRKNRLEVVNRRFFEIFGLPRDQIEPGTTSARFSS